MLTIDTHLHIFPFLGGASGYASVEERMRTMQYVGRHSMPRRKRDGVIVTEPTLWDGVNDNWDGLLDVNYRAGRFGRYEWDKDGETYYSEGFPPSLQDMESTADYMIAQMDFAGIDVAVLQNDYLYGYLNDYFGDAVRQYPDRFIGTVKLKEVEAFSDVQIAELNRCVTEFGFKGLFFQKAGFNLAGSTDKLNDPKFDVLWNEVQRLGMMLYLHGFFEDWLRIADIAARFPGIQIIHTLPTWNFPRDGIGRMPREGKIHLRQDFRELLAQPNFHFEISPIAYGALYEYPYTELIPTFRPFYEEFGGTKFVWGSDMPNLERWCTFQQGIDYFRLHWNFVSKEDKALITGGNASRIFKLEQPAPNGRVAQSASV